VAATDGADVIVNVETVSHATRYPIDAAEWLISACIAASRTHSQRTSARLRSSKHRCTKLHTAELKSNGSAGGGRHRLAQRAGRPISKDSTSSQRPQRNRNIIVVARSVGGQKLRGQERACSGTRRLCVPFRTHHDKNCDDARWLSQGKDPSQLKSSVATLWPVR
jgi:hypothetical protein